MTSKPVYSYEVVTGNGCGVHANGFKRCSEARKAMERIAARWSTPGTIFEIQRVQHMLPGSGRRYFVRKRSRWVPHRHDLDPEDRKPDWITVSKPSEGPVL